MLGKQSKVDPWVHRTARLADLLKYRPVKNQVFKERGRKQSNNKEKPKLNQTNQTRTKVDGNLRNDIWYTHTMKEDVKDSGN